MSEVPLKVWSISFPPQSYVSSLLSKQLWPLIFTIQIITVPQERSSDRDRGREINKEEAEKDGKWRKEEKAVTCFLNRLCHHSASAVCSPSLQSFLIYWKLMLVPCEPAVNRASVPPCSGKPPPHFGREQKGAHKTNEEKVNVFHQSYLAWEATHRRTHSDGAQCVPVL